MDLPTQSAKEDLPQVRIHLPQVSIHLPRCIHLPKVSKSNRPICTYHKSALPKGDQLTPNTGQLHLSQVNLMYIYSR
jgi:hypothetical protein